ncbi:aspartyl protease family protein [Winogradskyella tangerina]|uniref:aspartyl protease family protein n=1 Tax=Winogradskyella tangerina TaxID=2023240 RepID=UPI000DBE6894|nr:aspartyl protease family protein [Winogradskyella tangerina]
MKFFARHIILLFLGLFSSQIIAQGGFILNSNSTSKINFEFVSNLMIIPIEINDVKLSFVLDTGVSKPILFNLSNKDSLGLKNAKTFYLHGLGGDGQIEALKSGNNKFRLGEAINPNQDLYVVFDKSIDFTPRLGVLVHGIIGYDIFKDFVVEINYNSKYIRLHKPSAFKKKSSKKWETIPMEIYNKKPFIEAKVDIDNDIKDIKLLIDTGSSDALWLFEDQEKGLMPNDSLFFRDYLGKGLSGSVYGKRSKIKNFNLSNFNLKQVNVAYPDSASIVIAKTYKDRNGSLGGNILKRFNLFFDYQNQQLHLKKNSNFNDAFTYNNSGIVLEHNGTMFVKERIKLPSGNDWGIQNKNKSVQIDLSYNYTMVLKPIYRIVELRESSNAYKAGLRIGDILITINGKQAYNFKLPVINRTLHGKTGSTIRVKVEREGKPMSFKFKLDNAFKKNEPSN